MNEVEKASHIESMTSNHQTREAIDAARRARNEPGVSDIMKVAFGYYEMNALCYQAADGVTARAVGTELFALVDARPGILDKSIPPPAQRSLKEIYVSICGLMSDLALSYDEFDSCMARISGAGALTDHYRDSIRIVEESKENGESWFVNMILLADNFAGVSKHNQNPGNFGMAATLYGLILKERRQLRPPRDELARVAFNFGAYTANAVVNGINTTKASNVPTDMVGNMIPILDGAVALLEETRRDVNDAAKTDGGIAAIEKVRANILGAQKNAKRTFIIMAVIFTVLTALTWRHCLTVPGGSGGWTVLAVILSLITVTSYYWIFVTVRKRS